MSCAEKLAERPRSYDKELCNAEAVSPKGIQNHLYGTERTYPDATQTNMLFAKTRTHLTSHAFLVGCFVRRFRASSFAWGCFRARFWPFSKHFDSVWEAEGLILCCSSVSQQYIALESRPPEPTLHQRKANPSPTLTEVLNSQNQATSRQLQA